MNAGRLVERHPLRRFGDEKRYLLVTPQVANGLNGNDDGLRYCPMVQTEINIGRYCADHLVSVSLSGTKEADFERLTDLEEVWAFCARQPIAQQVRMLGRFADKKVFIGLGLYERNWLGSRRHYHEVAAKILETWEAILADLAPFSAQEPQGYLGEMVNDVDAKEAEN